MIDHQYQRVISISDIEEQNGANVLPKSERIPDESKRISALRPPILWILNAFLICMSLYLLLMSFQHRPTCKIQACGKRLSFQTHPELLDLAVQGYHIDRINASFSESNKYKDPPSLKPPSKAVDAAWHTFDNIGSFQATEEDLHSIGKDPSTAVQIPKSYGGGYLAYVEVVHQLHCLNLIRKATWGDHYRDDEYMRDSPLEVRRHIDHCIDIIRQNLMCTSDVGIYNYNWVRNIPNPMPDFNSLHMCRNFDGILQWSEQAAIKNVSLSAFSRKGTIELDEEP